MKTDEIRSRFLRFFEEKGCRLCPSDSLVPSNDPTLLFTGAGMNQFKDQFLGLGDMSFRRVASCQKCIRTGDIMNVGVTPSHHTFFEMLGNFSFGDYFKKEAILWAWEFLTGDGPLRMNIPEARLQVSIHESDDEAFAIWREAVGLPADRITRLGDHDNFWPADAPKLGPNGPCGPCSEIFYDRGPAHGEDLGITGDNHRWVEIWNLVFTQYDRQPDGTLDPLPQKNIDTGAGLERFASCLQDTPTNMDIDIFRPLTGAIAERAGVAYGAEKEKDVLVRRIADHARAIVFCIADGVLPANTHRGYVLKRLLRRAALDGRTLGIEGSFLHALVPVVGEAMGNAYPDVRDRAPAIGETVALEENRFLATLEKGLTLIDTAVGRAKEAGRTVLDGATAFELYDTYGFPYELAEEVVEKEGLTLDREGFDEALEAARARAREGATMKGDVFATGPILEVKKRTAGTEFLGYDADEAEAAVIALIAGEAVPTEAGADAEVTVVLDRTPFYGEAGGQVGDTGVLVGPDNLVVEITDTHKIDGIHLHVGRVESGTIREGMTVTARIDAERRRDIRRNHTVTHLLHHALRQVLGEKAEQKGSYVAPDRMRFDFQHGAALNPDQRRRVEEIVNRRILEDAPVETDVLSLEEARKRGAVALFGEKYGETVRVIRIGDFSMELCGGTHMDATAPIGSFRIMAEESVAAGVRRIEGLTGLAADRHARTQAELLAATGRELKVSPEQVPDRVLAVLEETKALRKEMARLKEKQVRERLASVEPREVAGVPCVILNAGEVLGKELVAAADTVKRRLGEGGVTVLAGTDGAKVGLVVAVGSDLAPKRLKAGDLVKKLAPMVGGGGGGRPDLAQAGGKDPSGMDAMLEAAPGILKAMLGGAAPE